MADKHVQRKLTTILLSDTAGYITDEISRVGGGR